MVVNVALLARDTVLDGAVRKASLSSGTVRTTRAAIARYLATGAGDGRIFWVWAFVASWTVKAGARAKGSVFASKALDRAFFHATGAVVS